MSFDKKLQTHKRIGIGGINCVCCGPAPGKKRRAMLRNGKKRVRLFWKRRAQERAAEGGEE